MLKINEIFWSAQGEGVESGLPAIFVRLAGCSLRCPYCDTRGAWARGRSMEVAAVAAAAAELKAAHPRSRLVVTGGEPLEQDLKGLLALFRRRRWFTAVETNGLHFQDLPCDWWTVSPKDVAGFRVHPRLWAKANEIKLLVTPALDLATVERLRGRCDAPIILQPQRHDRHRYRRAFAFFKACTRAGIPGVRLGLQLHAVYRVP
ncbi:MAG: 7-carboxy-7-deazaguanine synthase QueE [Candidatus Aminicenantes bacterium]|nr:7-carboxy-7-deazaguanine synthase QueE [Candidatus Aminicenantes bacterium]